MAFNPETQLVYIPARESGWCMAPLNANISGSQGRRLKPSVHQFFRGPESAASNAEYDGVVASYPSA